MSKASEMSDAKRSCWTCKWWLMEAYRVGYCRRLPPQVIMEGAIHVAVWPMTASSWWCGEWTKREGEKKS